MLSMLDVILWSAVIIAAAYFIKEITFDLIIAILEKKLEKLEKELEEDLVEVSDICSRLEQMDVGDEDGDEFPR